LATAFVFSLTIASFGHCWPMFAAQMQQMSVAEHHAGHHHQHPIPAHEHNGEMGVSGVASAASIAVAAPAAKLLPPEPLAAVASFVSAVAPPQLRDTRARAGPSAFAAIHARTGRLII
jgi:hypothetical protein